MGWLGAALGGLLTSEALMLVNARVFGAEERVKLFNAPLSYDAMRWRSKLILWTSIFEVVVVLALAALVVVRLEYVRLCYNPWCKECSV